MRQRGPVFLGWESGLGCISVGTAGSDAATFGDSCTGVPYEKVTSINSTVKAEYPGVEFEHDEGGRV